MHKLALKLLAVFLLNAVFLHYCDLAFMLEQHFPNERVAKANCGCNADVCCCTSKLNSTAGSICKVNQPEPEQSDSANTKRPAFGPAFVDCGASNKIPFISSLKQVLPISIQTDITYFPTFIENVFDLKAFQTIEFKHAVFRPPRS